MESKEGKDKKHTKRERSSLEGKLSKKSKRRRTSLVHATDQTDHFTAKKEDQHCAGSEVDEDEAEAVQTEEKDDRPNLTGRLYTVSIAIPGSIIDNAQSPQLKTYLAGQISRAATIFNVDEVIVFDELGSTMASNVPPGNRPAADPNLFITRVLQYLETPQYLRKSLCPMHPDLKYAGLLNPLDAPHHMREDEEAEFREGVVLKMPVKKSKSGRGSYVNCGLSKKVQVDRTINPGMRVTVRMTPCPNCKKYLRGVAVSPSIPRTEAGYYWGYCVRFAHSLGAVFTEAPFKGGYDLTIGTSDSGDVITELPKFSHLLIVFGGVRGLEFSLENDQNLFVEDVRLLFDQYINTCPGQGSRTIRTEEAVLITLSCLRPMIVQSGRS